MKQKRSKLKDIAIETKIKHTGKKKKDWQKHDQSISELWDNLQQLRYMYLMSKKGVEG